jgi:hypothetical protein
VKKIAQNVANTLLSKLMHKLNRGKKYRYNPKIWATSVILIKLPKVNNHQLGKNSPNLFTLDSKHNGLIVVLEVFTTMALLIISTEGVDFSRRCCLAQTF